MNEDTIIMLKGPDRVRRRPAVIFGTEGALGCVRMLLEIFATEAELGHSDGVTLSVSDGVIDIVSYDRGFMIDTSIHDGRPKWQEIFCELYAGPAYPDYEYYQSLGREHNELYGCPDSPFLMKQIDASCGFSLCCVQYASEHMRVDAVRDGVKTTLDFRKGYSVSDAQKSKTDARRGTYIRFRPDPEVFGSVLLSEDKLRAVIDEVCPICKIVQYR